MIAPRLWYSPTDNKWFAAWERVWTDFKVSQHKVKPGLNLLPREATSLLHYDGLNKNREKYNPEEHGILETLHDVPAVGDGPSVELVEDLGDKHTQAVQKVKLPPAYGSAALHYVCTNSTGYRKSEGVEQRSNR